MTMRADARRLAVALLALTTLVTSFAAQSGASHTKKKKTTVTTRRIGPGAVYTRTVIPKKHQVIHQIAVKLAARTSIDVALADDEMGNTEVLSSLASDNGAIAAINGDFGSREGRPWNLYAEDGHLVQTERTWGRALAVNVRETKTFIGHPKAKIWMTPVGGTRSRINRVNNDRPEGSELALYTALGHKVEDIPKDACSARLLPLGKPKISASGAVIQRNEVDLVRCASYRMSMGEGQVVAARRNGDRAVEIEALVPGSKVKLSWRMNIKEIVDVIGGNPLIVDKGRVLYRVVRDCGYLCEMHPRSAVGITKDKRLLMVVVDGRRSNARGMYLHELARYFVDQGAQRAMTFDGGGAAEMWIRGRVVNSPSDGHEREVVNGLLLLPATEKSQPTAPPTSALSL